MTNQTDMRKAGPASNFVGRIDVEYGLNPSLPNLPKAPSPNQPLQGASFQNVALVEQVNEKLREVRYRLFSEGEGSEPCRDKEGPAPMPSVLGSSCMTQDGLVLALKQLESILNRL